MAEASCSGSTPFKRLVDHQSRDVSHHQDRLVHRSGLNGHGSFRSTPLHPAPGQDGFGAFIDASPAAALPVMPHDPARRLAVHAAALQPAHTHPELSHARATPVSSLSSGWAADFGRFSTQQGGRSGEPAMQRHQQHQQHQQLSFQAAFGQSAMPFSPIFGHGTTAGFAAPPVESDFDQEMARWMSSHGGGNMSDVDAVMDQMARELEINESALPETSTATESTSATTTARPDESAAHLTDLETPEIVNLGLHDPAAIRMPPHATQEPEQLPDQQQPSEDAAAARGKSAVSEAAERLLESVQHEDGEKWQNSVFLSLMRDFRDGRKDIVDNKIRQMAEGRADEIEAESLT